MRQNVSKKGFTLIEVIAVLVVLVITAGAGVIGVDNFLTHADQTARNSVARTVFLAAQTALTQKYNQDRNFYDHCSYPFIPDVSAISPALSTEEQEKQAHTNSAGGTWPALVYLVLNNGQTAGNDLYNLLDPYINDKEIFNHSILIEFNRETGMMLSAFYTDADGVTLGYGSGGAYNVNNRGMDALTNGLIGFYGVDSTGDVIRGTPIDVEDYSILLVDHTDYATERGDGYGTLTAEIGMPKLADVDPSFQLTMTLLPEGSGSTNESVSFASVGAAGVDFTLDQITANRTLEAALQNPLALRGRKIAVYYTENSVDGGKLTFILDCVQSFGAAENLSINKQYPGVKGGFLKASLKITDGADTVMLYSDDTSSVPVHAFYSGESDNTTGVNVIKSVRHLNNIRYSQKAEKFQQAGNIYMNDCLDDRLNFTPLCNKLDSWKDGDDDVYGFLGTYSGDAAYAIFDLKIDLTGQSGLDTPDDPLLLYNAGLFDTVRAGARVEKVRLAASQPITNAVPQTLLVLHYNAGDARIPMERETVAIVKGVTYAGGIAAVNEGTLDECAAFGYVSAACEQVNNGTAGGIVGANLDGTVGRCFAAADVVANTNAGGIAGENTGSINYCEAGTASWRSAQDADRLYLSGKPVFGAYSDSSGNGYQGGTYTANNTFRAKIEKDFGAAGGITGYVHGATARVTGCVSAMKVEAGNEVNGEGAHAGGKAGGIAGHLAVGSSAHTIDYCYNAGAVYATYAAGGVVGEITSGAIAYCYNTGYVDWEYEALTYFLYDTSYFLPGISRNLGGSPNRAGGIVGSGTAQAQVYDCYSMQYAGDAYGGAFGIMDEDAVIENCCFKRNIKNNAQEYYIDASHRIEAAQNKLRMYSTENLRAAPDNGKLDSTAFVSGNFISPFGKFSYLFPRLITPNYSGMDVHRTPWHPSLERYGQIYLSGRLTHQDDVITCTFYIAPPEGTIVLYPYPYTPDFQRAIYIPLNEEPDTYLGANSLTHLRRQPNVWMDVYGYNDQNYTQHAVGDYTFQIRAVTLNAANANDAIRLAQGYSFRYEIRFSVGPNATKYHHIPTSVTDLTAELYNKYKATDFGAQYVDRAILSTHIITLSKMTQGNHEATALGLDLGLPKVVNKNQPYTYSVELQLTFDSGEVYYLTIPADTIRNAKGSLNAAINDVIHDNNTSYISAYYTKYPIVYEASTVDPANDGKINLIWGWTGGNGARPMPNNLTGNLPLIVAASVMNNGVLEHTYYAIFEQWP